MEGRETDRTEGTAEAQTSRRVVVANQLGLHARPAARLASEAQGFSANISIACDGQVVDAKSILDLLTLAAGKGSILTLRASGEDADRALDHLEGLFLRRFDEER